MSFLGLGSAFWGIVVGMVAYWILHASAMGRKEKQK
jgi:benzoate membrane transport protein